MDIKAKIGEIVTKIKADENFASNFQSDPVKAIKSVIGIDLPDDQVKAIIDGVKAKINLDGIGGLLGKVGKLF